MNINLNGTTNVNLNDFTVTFKLDPSTLTAFTAFTAAGAHPRSEQQPAHEPQPAQRTQQTTVRPTNPCTRNDSHIEVDDVLSLDSSSAKNSVASDGNEDEVTVESLTYNVIGRIDQHPVYHWKNYPYAPNGPETDAPPVCFFVKKPDETDSESGATPAFNLKFAYSYLTYGSETRRPPYWVRKQCLGVFQCTMKGCKFLATPMRGPKKGKTALPGECKDRCPRHKEQILEHRACHARLMVNEDLPGHYCVQVLDKHVDDHPIPPQTFDRIPTIIKRGMVKKIIAYKDLGASALIIGTPQRPGLYNEFPGNPAVLNRDAVRRLKATTLKASPSSDILKLLSVYLKTKKLIVSHSVAEYDFHFSMQDDHCRKLTNETTYPLESDAVEGFLKVTNDFPDLFDRDNATGVMITSSYNAVTSRWCPLLITLLGGRSADHYYHHFKVLLRTFNVAESYEEFVDRFPGHTTDFSLAQSNGFLRACREYVQMNFLVQKTDHELQTSLILKFCKVHFKRTLFRVARNKDFIPSEQSQEFIDAVLRLLSFKYGEVDQFMECFLQILHSYAEIGPWLKWHIQPGIATVLFPACKDFTSEQSYQRWRTHVPDNTNAAESMCRKFQDMSEKKYMNLIDCIPWTEYFLQSFAIDHREASEGVASFYGIYKKKTGKKKKRRSGMQEREQSASKRRQRQSQEDHRPPDTAERLTQRTKSPPKRMPRKVTKRDSLVDIPYGTCTSVSLLNRLPNEYTAEVDEVLKKYSIAAVPWSIKRTLTHPGVLNTCGFDSILFVLYFLQRNNILQGGLPGFYHPDSKAPQIFALLDEDKGDEARRLLLSETYRQVHDYNMVSQLESPGHSVSVWSAGTDSLSVLMYKARFHFKECVGCTNFCSEKDAWRDKFFPYHGVVLYEFPPSLESYLEEQLFGENIVGKSRCSIRIARDDIVQIRNNNDDFAMNRSYVDTLIESNPFTCPGMRSYDRKLISIQSLFVLSCG
jgi:hypothetical protein